MPRTHTRVQHIDLKHTAALGADAKAKADDQIDELLTQAFALPAPPAVSTLVPCSPLPPAPPHSPLPPSASAGGAAAPQSAARRCRTPAGHVATLRVARRMPAGHIAPLTTLRWAAASHAGLLARCQSSSRCKSRMPPSSKRHTEARRCTSAPALGSPLPHLRRDRAHRTHICAETGLEEAPFKPAAALPPARLAARTCAWERRGAGREPCSSGCAAQGAECRAGDGAARQGAAL